MSTETDDIKAPRDRSPSFPFIPLKVAVERLAAFEEYHKRSPAAPGRIGPAWEMKPNSSSAQQTLAALKAFGLLESQRGPAGVQIVISDDGRTYLRAQQENIKRGIIKKAALRPPQIAAYWEKWGLDRPKDPECLDILGFDGGFSPDGAEKFLRVYDATIAFAGLAESDKITRNDQPAKEAKSEKPPVAVRVGDYVLWESAGVEQFKAPCRVTRIEEGFAFVHGSMTGMPMTELTVVDPPIVPQVGTGASKSASSAYAGEDGGLNVLLRGKRLEITADVGREGLARLKEILGKYEEILNLIDPPSGQK
jgi:hypothetical protein